MTMIWHILRKDVTLLWKEILIVALLNAIAIGARLRLSNSIEHTGDFLLIAVSVVSAYVLLTKAVHLDAPANHRLDWLVRPIRRRDLILAKLLFAAFAFIGPIILLDVLLPMAAGFSIPLVIKAASIHAIGLLIGLALPMLAFASMSGNIGEAVLIPALLIPASYLIDNAFRFLPGHNVGYRIGVIGPPAASSRLQWTIDEILAYGVAGLAGALILTLLYRTRNRWIGATILAIALTLSVASAPISGAFRSREPNYSRSPGNGVSLHYAPDQPRYISSTAYGTGTIHLPLLIKGLEPDESIYVESILAQAMFADGKKLDGYGGAAGQFSTRYIYPPVHFNNQIWYQQSLQPAKLSLDISVIVLGSAGTFPVPWSGTAVQVPGVGLCRVARPLFGQASGLNCVQVGSEVAPIELQPATLKFVREPWVPGLAARYFDLTNNPAGIFTNHSMMFNGAPDPSNPGDVMLRTFRVKGFRSVSLTIPEIRFADWDSTQTIR
jgi:hypothetical protein